MKLLELLFSNSNKSTYLAEIVGGDLYVNRGLKENDDLIDAAWVSVRDLEKWDSITQPVLKKYLERMNLMSKGSKK